MHVNTFIKRRIDVVSDAAQRCLVRIDPVRFWRWEHRRRGSKMEVELNLIPFFCARGRPMVDVGANTGVYVSLCQPYVERSFAFEPVPKLASLLRRALSRRPVEVHQVAVSDANATATLRLPRGHSSVSTIADTNRLEAVAERVDEVEVRTRTLDSYELDDVGFVKIDVEGHEPAVIRGADATLRRCRPHLLLEAEERYRAGIVAELAAMLADRGYEGFFIASRTLHSVKSFDRAKHQRRGRGSEYIRNFIYVPSEDAPGLRAFCRRELGIAAAAPAKEDLPAPGPS
ncbi:MAG: methyltransferase [Proteobacteria bacterium]|nr:MAG: methyltransferase [Pseudomonadota bacterium]